MSDVPDGLVLKRHRDLEGMYRGGIWVPRTWGHSFLHRPQNVELVDGKQAVARIHRTITVFP